MKEAGIFMQQVKEDEVVDAVTLLSANSIKQQLQEDSQLSQIMSLITAQDLPHQISVKVKPSASLDEIESFVNNLTINPQVEYVSYDKQWLTQLQALTDTLLQMARISAFMFILIVMVILGNTIANEIIDHKDELRLLELIGASWAQVRRSFLYMGIFFGVIAGMFSVLFLSISFWWIKDTTSSLLENFGIELTLHGLNFSQISVVVLLSILVTWLAARLSLSSQRLNQIND
jgi:cell division transport system permease protein